jgi:hypothetical protein
MDRFVNRENIERYRRLASEMINDTERLRILKLLAEANLRWPLPWCACPTPLAGNDQDLSRRGRLSNDDHPSNRP